MISISRIRLPLLGTALLGAAILAAPSALAQNEGSSRNGAARDPLERRGQVDLDDRYPSQYPYGRTGNRGASDGAGAAERSQALTGRDAFDQGYRAGRDEEQRRQASRSGGTASGGEVDHYSYVPDILPDTPRYRGMQDFALIPDRSRQMDRLLAATQSLREAIQALAQLPASNGRDVAMDRLHDALLETQQAMTALPREARLR